MKRKKFRRRFFTNANYGTCSLCQFEAAQCQPPIPIALLDLDHKIPLGWGGEDLPRNIWSLCLNHHRIKSNWECWLKQAVQSESFCWSCQSVNSKYFVDEVSNPFCKTCQTNGERYTNVERLLRAVCSKNDVASSED